MIENNFYDQALLNVKEKRGRTIPIQGMDSPDLAAGFTTRFGGVSQGVFESLNLNFYREDDPDSVKRNFELLSHDVGVNLENMVLTRQIHSKNVIRVGQEHKGMGILKDRSYEPVDGLTTNEKGLMLVTYYADCIPLYFYDPKKQAICLSHSGWKGTLLDIAGESVRVMKACYDSQPEDIRMSFGPHIRQCCFEVGDEVADEFFNTYSGCRDSAYRNSADKWMLNLEEVITRSLISHGLKKDNITGCSLCTRCQKDVFFSHRGGGGKTGTGAAYLMMKG